MVDVLDWSSAAIYRNSHNTTPKSTWTETNHGSVRCPTSKMLHKSIFILLSIVLFMSCKDDDN